jgi:hypothetical protein
VFVGSLIWLNVANLRHLVFAADDGALALFLLLFFNDFFFACAQFAIAVMSVAVPDEGESGGRQARRICGWAWQPSVVKLSQTHPKLGRVV